MRIIFLGIMFCEESIKESYNIVKRGISIAPHVFQSNLLSGFTQLENVEIDVLNIPPIGSFPINNKALFLPRYQWGKNNVQIGYLNLPFVKQKIQERKILKEIKKRINDDESLKIVVYSVYEPFLNIIKKVKKKYPNIEICLIQTDPIAGRGERDRYMTKAMVKEGNRIVAKSKVVDKFVLLTKYLSDPLEVSDRPFIVMECVCDNTQSLAKPGNNKNICLYTGTLNQEFGIKELAEAFAEIPNAELWVCGDGDTKNFLLEYVKTHSNIKYYGFLTQEEIAQKRDECDFLINPRRPTGTYTKYSFPSKTAEYMMTGKPVIMYKLEGVPDEYDEFLNYLSSDKHCEMVEELKTIFAKDYYELIEKGLRGREFLQNNKNGLKQARFICDLLGSSLLDK